MIPLSEHHLLGHIKLTFLIHRSSNSRKEVQGWCEVNVLVCSWRQWQWGILWLGDPLPETWKISFLSCFLFSLALNKSCQQSFSCAPLAPTKVLHSKDFSRYSLPTPSWYLVLIFSNNVSACHQTSWCCESWKKTGLKLLLTIQHVFTHDVQVEDTYPRSSMEIKDWLRDALPSWVNVLRSNRFGSWSFFDVHAIKNSGTSVLVVLRGNLSRDSPSRIHASIKLPPCSPSW